MRPHAPAALPLLLTGLLLASLLPRPAQADQFAYMDQRQATDAMQAIGQGKDIVLWCAPCTGDVPERIAASDIGMGRVWDSPDSSTVYKDAGGNSYWTLDVAGKEIDLAYAYVPRNGRWRNLALLLGLPAEDVPEYLPRDKTPR